MAQSKPNNIAREIKKIGLVYLLIDKLTDMQKVSNILMKRPKLGLDYLRASLSEMDIDSDLYDQQILNFNCASLIKYILKDKIDLLGFYICTENINNALNYIDTIKKSVSVPIIAGGPASSLYSKELLKAGCDIICTGEGDFTIKDIISFYAKKINNIEDIKGIAYLDNYSRIIFTHPRPLIKDLDSLPFSYRDKKYINKYNNYLLYTIKKPYISIMASRGCVYKCAFCTSHIFWNNTYRQRSVENVIEEIEANVKLYHIKYIEFIDDIFAQNIYWLEKFCNILKEKKLNLKWLCILHPLSFRGNKKVFSMMAEAGCDAISFGAQSANKKILENINRNPEEPEELKKSIYYAKLNNITTIVTYIFGLPGDNSETIYENYKFCLDTKPHLVDFHPLHIIKSSELDIKYKNNKPTELTTHDLFKLSRLYMRKYYLRPEIILPLLKDILNKNPKWFLDIVGYSPLMSNLFVKN